MFGKLVIMGCKIWEFIGSFLLDCINIVIMCNLVFCIEGVLCVECFEDVVEVVMKMDCVEIMVIGGVGVYWLVLLFV